MGLPLLGMIGDALDKIVPDADTRMEMKAKAAQLELDGEFKHLEIAMEAIVMEAKSKDPWTSRARPSFLYVMYALILSSIPVGLAFIFYPQEVKTGIMGFQLWLAAIPSELYALFGAGYLGYNNKRSQDKATALGQPVQPGLLSKILG